MLECQSNEGDSNVEARINDTGGPQKRQLLLRILADG